MRQTFRFWLVYGIAWLPFVASYLILLVIHLGRPLIESIKPTIITSVPPVLLGIGVVAICDRFRWRPQRPVGFFATHLSLAVLYFVLWMSSAQTLSALDRKIAHALPSDSGLSDSSFEVSFVTGFLIYVAIAGAVYAMQTVEKLRVEQARVAELENLSTRVHEEATSTGGRSDQWLNRLLVKNGRGEIVPVRVADIVRFVGADDYVEVFANSSAFLVKLTLTELEKRLDPEHFRRIHRSAIVNLDHLVSCREVDRRLVLKLSDGAEVTASHSGSQSLRELIV
jgi:DNA-binding LytR/AlgR family response regulator